MQAVVDVVMSFDHKVIDKSYSDRVREVIVRGQIL